MKKTKKKRKFPEILLVISALFLGILVIILVYQNRTMKTISGKTNLEDRELSGDFPLPSEIIEADRTVYFSYCEIPDMIFKKMQGKTFYEDTPVAREDLRYLNVLYWGADGKAHKGELIVNKNIADDVSDIFFKLYKASYPIQSVRLMNEYNGNDEVSMADNNTSCFNSRKKTGGGTWSAHAYGMAVDINPFYNPYVGADGVVLPVAAKTYADRNLNFVMKINEKDYAYELFTEHGFEWGGSWSESKDYQHFEKK